MNLSDLGYNVKIEKARQETELSQYEIGRITAEHKERYSVRTEKGEFDAEITGNLRFTAQGREDFPAVGDWVALTIYEPDFAIIHKILPRYSVIKRQAVGQYGEVQIIAANIDYAFIVQAVDRDFSVNRLERYLTICYSSKVKPVIVLSKIDLIEPDRICDMIENVKTRIVDVPVLAISNETHSGYEAVRSFIEKGQTYCLLGSSGVGKSTLLNNLCGQTVMQTETISVSTNRGRHVTTHRELIILENGGILIDNPGLREVGIADNANGLEITFDRILEVGQNCKFKDCSHTHESGCAVIAAIESGEIDRASFENYLKMEREKAHFESTVAERRQRDKAFGKMLKNYHKDQRNNKP
jgi:ribosome biogenesis GTPase